MIPRSTSPCSSTNGAPGTIRRRDRIPASSTSRIRCATPYKASVDGPSYKEGAITLPSVDVSSARAVDGKLWLSLVNLDPKRPAHVTTNLPGTASGRILTGATMDAHNTFENPYAIHPVPFAGRAERGKLVFDLPARSVAVVRID